MNVIFLLSLFASNLTLIIGIYILILNRKSLVNILFFILSLSLFTWLFSLIFGSFIDDEKILFYFVKLGILSSLLFSAFILHFSLELTQIIKPYKNLIFFYHIITVRIIYQLFYDKSFFVINEYIKKNNYWLFNININIWTIFFLLYLYLSIILSLIVIFYWGIKSKQKRIKKQSMIFFCTLLISIILSTIEVIIIPFILKKRILVFTPLLYSIWLIGVTISIVKYKFLSLTTESIYKDIVSNIEESIVIFDENYKIIKINNATEKNIDQNNYNLIKRDLASIICESEIIKNEIEKIKKTNLKNFSYRANYIKNDKTKILMDIKISIIKDKFKDMLGGLLIAKKVKGIKQLKTHFKITEREAEVIQHILLGYKNKDIAIKINTTERTVKAHITNIYNKLGVDNKIQMFAFLKDFNLIPDYNTEKIVL
jgi:DNA-binding CsgD family transcriptional regulator